MTSTRKTGTFRACGGCGDCLSCDLRWMGRPVVDLPDPETGEAPEEERERLRAAGVAEQEAEARRSARWKRATYERRRQREKASA